MSRIFVLRCNETSNIANNMTDVNKTGKSGKESFKWSTPADEFAEDVGSDEGEDAEEAEEQREGTISPYDDDDDNGHDIGGNDDPDYEDEEDEDNPDGDGIIINLGVEEANRYAVNNRKVKAEEGESAEDIKRWLDNYEKKSGGGEKTKKYESKQRFPCPKCNKIWNWPWELRRHLMTHFKEVQGN